jgi:uncharacterized protein YndB with AHSA1/START domain
MTAVAISTKAEVSLPSDTEILITREFDAPRHLVYRAWTTPELIMRWWAGDHGEVTSVEVDLRVGGAWRYVMKATGGFEVGFHGEYREIVTNERIVSTSVFEGMPGESSVSTLTLAEAGGRTILQLLTQHTSKQNRDMEINSGMESGMQSSWAMLEQVAASLA